MDAKIRALQIIKLLKKEYPAVRVALDFSNPIEILVATILSAQCTDKRVNIVTKDLFKKYGSVKDYAKADLKTFQKEIRSTGFYRNKAKNIVNAAKKIVNDFGGRVPDTMDGLVSLPGVARKTANIVLTSAFGKVEGIAVDTHALRLSKRLGLSRFSDPVKVERDLMAVVAKKDWGSVNFLLVNHGRAVCNAKKPLHDKCVLYDLCPSRKI
ncbi:MAG: endonuclease III [Candidatus Omnitrophica bacterium CG12_big_fil_rev_8_21_14_0_65_43_15]|uniref:Endonuclease III n=1 Tax=Candidatus Taenaricola geysiri TaxID=1974752 RepID=A0A2J0LIA2_9BACT|nr:MAG: endonuclease III [Candidatus Omnitrophica bacterium CG1_02_43_210]PIV12246.1 MAG: endonuclease III [Candidatus Omnitrophica bacterium CG03_land_8_20_14_0_80_43_22]PIW66939.1 MAG: endonuclease III [Candidatus Omnitrophica bacterium CG12_big_fil_rev_8_21_14_0_65_43_15]PIW79872.1 MAG: endonuclease III [Candidatus Omnitrophica bacterium CG_4_8_14_3_um_filter_43_15]PIY83583.1 MAG: endonuclease III [Candidatus Omnitrophica bacterium CG_4_10_14_0_8_um_filter_43_18]PJC46196.1 MAG: endonuclease